MQKWQRAALKKWSLALYLRRGLSMALVPTCEHMDVALRTQGGEPEGQGCCQAPGVQLGAGSIP